MADFRDTLLLSRDDALEQPPDSSGAGSARLVSYRNTEVIAEANAPKGGGWLVLRDVDHPWWFAEVDGAPAPILRADVMFRAVRVPEGRHEARFVFRPLAGLWRELMGR